MCGIAGIVDFGGTSDTALLWSMADALSRRGPDASGIWNDSSCGLAHTRLSIIDVQGSSQPMVHADKGMAIVYNGELYNFEELRTDLEVLGENFESSGDTEVVLQWLAREWTDALPRFDAMFAIGCWDIGRQRLLLARDALGEKPLYYALPAPGVLIFGSEPKALLRHPAIQATLNEGALRQALRFRAVYSDTGLVNGIHQLMPGSYLEFSRSGITLGRFYNSAEAVQCAKQSSVQLNDDELVKKGQALFIDSVRERLVADVPVGAFLSGGLDSSLIVATMRKLLPPSKKIETFSVGFVDDPHSEIAHAKLVADTFGTEHHTIMVGPETYIKRLAELSACRDGPVSQPADVAIAEMSRIARNSVKVVLSGEGADEVFAGYPKHGFADPPWMLKKCLSYLGVPRAVAIARLFGLDERRTRVAITAIAGTTELERLVQWFSYFDQGQLLQLFPKLGWAHRDLELTTAPQRKALAEAPQGSSLLKMQMVDLATWLPSNLLERGDRMTMSEGLELRPPFLDRELVAFGLSLPDRMKIRAGVGKWMVRQWAQNVLPTNIVKRPKWGFRVPLDKWFRGPLRDMAHGYLTGEKGLVGRYGDRRAISELLLSHESGKIDAGESLWTLLAAEVWYCDVFLPRQSGEFARPD